MSEVNHEILQESLLNLFKEDEKADFTKNQIVNRERSSGEQAQPSKKTTQYNKKQQVNLSAIGTDIIDLLDNHGITIDRNIKTALSSFMENLSRIID